MMLERFAVAAALCGAFGCATGTAYKTAVHEYAAHTPEYARAVSACAPQAGGYSEDCVAQWAFPMAGLQCLVDEDEGRSPAAAPSAACKCARPADAAARKASCTAWLTPGAH